MIDEVLIAFVALPLDEHFARQISTDSTVPVVSVVSLYYSAINRPPMFIT